MVLDPRVPGRESKEAAERLSRIFADNASGIDGDIRYHFAKTGFHLTRRSAADPEPERRFRSDFARRRRETSGHERTHPRRVQVG